jgi:hypothetical protein
MRLVRVVLPALLVLLGSCSPPSEQEGALRVRIDTGSMGLRSTCVKLEVRDLSMQPLRLSKGAPLAGRRFIVAGVPRETFPQTVVVQAIGFSGAECTQRTSPDEVSEVKEATFPTLPDTLRDVELTLAPAAVSVDADGDLVPLPQDCDDLDPQVAPGKPEACTDQKDNDCNQAVDCADTTCAGMQCRGVGSTCAGGRCTEVRCDDSLDNDGADGADCADSDCEGRPCRNGGTCTAGACMGAMSEQGLCADGVDNDMNDGTDCVDPDCNGELCSDGRGCTTGERCSNSGCDGGQPVTCVPGANVCASSSGVCLEPDGGCLYAPLPGDAGCSDGLACTLGDACDGDGGCTGTSLRLCDAPPSGCYAPTGTCDEALDGGCRYTVVAGLGCDDQNACTRDEACLLSGACMGGSMVDCASVVPPTECEEPTGTCSPATGCEFRLRTGPCGDGGTCLAGQCITPDAGPPDAGVPDAGSPADAGQGMDAGEADAGGGDAGTMDAGPNDAGGPADAGVADAGAFLLPSNIQLGQLPTGILVPAHYDLNCSGTLSLNNNLPTFVSDNLGCLAPLLPPSVRVSQGAGLPELVVFAMNRLTIRPGVTLRFAPGFASAGSVVPVFAVRGDAAIGGTIDVTAIPGPGRTGVRDNAPGGGGDFCPVVPAGGVRVDRSGGGAGGSFGRPGGPGGRGADFGTQGGAGATPGTANGTETLVPLRGGCAGSAGGNAANGFGRAAGAIQVWAQGTLTVTGRIVASGGPGVVVNGTFGAGGGGGGSGGGVLLEARTLLFGPAALVAANGGSGAQGNGTNNTGVSGSYGTVDVTRAAGGAGGAQCGGPGGAGGARAGDAGVGVQGDLDPACTINGYGGGGGGGGGVGRVRLNALTGCQVDPQARFSPPTTSAQASCQR